MPRTITGELRFHSVVTEKETYECGEAKVVSLHVRRCKPFGGKFFISCHVIDPQGFMILQCDSGMVGGCFDVADAVHAQFTIHTPWLKPGCYRLDFFIHNNAIIDRFEHACDLNVIPLLPYPVAGSDSGVARGVVFADFTYGVIPSGASAVTQDLQLTQV
jgi:lipopolysaccharide transport system ATP-binding protein